MAAYTSSAIDYFSSEPVQGAIESGIFTKHYPVNTLNDSTNIIFNMPSVDRYFTDVAESNFDISMKIVKANGTDLVAEDLVAFVDNTAYSLFKSVDVFIHGVSITPSTIQQTLANYFSVRFGTGEAGAKIHLAEIQGLTGEDAGQHNAHGDLAVGWTARKAWTALSKEVHFKAPIPHDFFRTCAQFLPPMTDWRIEFKLNSPEFALNGTTTPFKFVITSFNINTRMVAVAPGATMSLFKEQLKKPFKLPFTSLVAQTFTISAAKQTEFIRGIFPRETPSQIYLMFVNTADLNGVGTTDPFNFQNGMIEKIVLRQNGEPVMCDAQLSNFHATAPNAIDLYYNMLQTFDVAHNGLDMNVTYDQFLKGCTLWAWTISGDMDPTNGVPVPQRAGNFEADIYVKNNHTTNVGLTAVFLGKCRKRVEIHHPNIVTLL